MCKGYHQIEMDEESIPVTAFITHDGSYEWLRLPMGGKSCPSVFVRAMNHIFAPLIGKCMYVYLDDVVIYSPTFEQHLKDLEAVFQCLQE